MLEVMLQRPPIVCSGDSTSLHTRASTARPTRGLTEVWLSTEFHTSVGQSAPVYQEAAGKLKSDMDRVSACQQRRVSS